MKCSFRDVRWNGDGSSTFVCETHHGLEFTYGDPKVIMYHRCPMGLHEDGIVDAPPAPPLPEGIMTVIDDQVYWRQEDGSYRDRFGTRVSFLKLEIDNG